MIARRTRKPYITHGTPGFPVKSLPVLSTLPGTNTLNPPNVTPPATQAPPWFGLPRRALLFNNNDILQAAQAVDAPFGFGAGTDALGDRQPPFNDSTSTPIMGPVYRAQDEYLEWITLKDPDGVVREVWFTCEAPNYWNLIAQNDQTLLINLYAELLGVAANQIVASKLFFQQDCSQKNIYAAGATLQYKKGDYNPYNDYNIQAAVHLTQGANTLDAEIGLGQAGSLIYGTPPKTDNPDLICCAEYGDPNRNSDPQIGKEVNDLVRQGMYVTLRDPIGLYMASIDGAQFTDWNDNAIPNIAADFFAPIRKSPDGTLILRARFKVPDGLMRNGKQARVGDIKYQGQSIAYGGQVANAIRMNLFAQAIPGAPAQNSQACVGHACFNPTQPGFVVLTPINTPSRGHRLRIF